MAERQFTPEEVQHMRTIIAQEDKKGIREFDLNNPPKEQYRHQEYPKMVYNPKTGGNAIAKDAEDEAAAIAAGWTLKPAAPAADPDAEGKPAEEEADPFVAGRKKGRPRKE